MGFISLFKPYLKYLIALIVFFALTAGFTWPTFMGKTIDQPDIVRFKAMSKELRDFRTDTGEEALWTNNMFSGMPAYQISVVYKGNLLQYITKSLGLVFKHPVYALFISMLCFYILLLSFKVDYRLAIVCAIAYAFSTYFIVILKAGHNSKAITLAYSPLVFAGFVNAFKSKYWLGFFLTCIGLSMSLSSGHPQMTYYLAIVILFYVVFEFYNHIRNKQIKNYFIGVAVVCCATLLAIGTDYARFSSSYKYAKQSIRGEGRLAKPSSQIKKEGLDWSYITDWSYGATETLTLMIPNYKGGISEPMVIDHKKVLKKIPPAFKKPVGQIDAYYGNQPFTEGPVYVGAFIVFLFVFSLFILDNYLAWSLIVALTLSIMLAWGKYLMPLTAFFIENIPFYNKFRSVSSILVNAELILPIMAALGLSHIAKNLETIHPKFKKAFFWSLLITAGFCLVCYIMPTWINTFDRSNEYEDLLYSYMNFSNANKPEEYWAKFLSAMHPYLVDARVAIFKADVIRSFLIIILGSIFLWLFVKRIIKLNLFAILIGVLITADLINVNLRYLNTDNYVSEKSLNTRYTPTPTDLEILKDTSLYYRVLNTTTPLDNDARTSYFHKSVGGYHAAKLGKYQDVIDLYLNNERLQAGSLQPQVVNMLNAKYIIKYDTLGREVVQKNKKALGNAWFVSSYKQVNSPTEALEQLAHINVENEVVLIGETANMLPTVLMKDSNAVINLNEYQPNYLKYTYQSNTQALAVFSEVFYEEGWNAYLDDKPFDYFNANYILRAALVPEGNHMVEFKFEPQHFYFAEKVSLASSIVFIIILFSYLGGRMIAYFKKKELTS